MPGFDIFGDIMNGIGAGLNYANQQQNLAWQKKAQGITWQREDNAVQRRAADMEKAGLSKTLAAGGAAQASAPISTTAPQIDLSGIHGPDPFTAAQAVMAVLKQRADITQTQAQTDLIKNQLATGKLSLSNAQDTRAFYKQMKLQGFKGHLPVGQDLGAVIDFNKNLSAADQMTGGLIHKVMNPGHSRKYVPSRNRKDYAPGDLQYDYDHINN